jgi:hypothetical protein
MLAKNKEYPFPKNQQLKIIDKTIKKTDERNTTK